MPDLTDQGIRQSQDTAPAAPSHPDTVTLRHDGQEQTVPWDEAISLAQQGYDYTQKTQQVQALSQDYFNKHAELARQQQEQLGRQQQFEEDVRTQQDYAQRVEQYVQQLRAQAQGQGQINYQQVGYDTNPANALPQQPPQLDQYGQPYYQQPPQLPQMPQAPQAPQAPQPQQRPVEQPPNRLDGLEANLEEMRLESEMAGMERDHEFLREECPESPWHSLLLTVARLPNMPPLREVATEMARQAEAYRKWHITQYVNAKEQGSAGPQVMPSGRPAMPEPIKPLSNEEYEDDGIHRLLEQAVAPGQDVPIP